MMRKTRYFLYFLLFALAASSFLFDSYVVMAVLLIAALVVGIGTEKIENRFDNRFKHHNDKFTTH